MKFVLSYFLLIPSPLHVYENNLALENLNNKETRAAAIQDFSILVQEQPDNLVYIWNLAQAFAVDEQFESAHKVLDSVISKAETMTHSKEQSLFNAYFNKAHVYAIEKKQTEAIEYYEKALDIFPYSKEVVVNLELLLSGQGKGKGNNESEKQEDQEGKGEEQNKKDEQEGKDQKPKSNPTPKPFNSKDLSKNDVKRILNELKRQEEKIRERLQEQQPKERSNGKDW